MSRTALYRIYADDALLYVGMTHNALSRLYTHFLTKEWAEEITMIKVEWFETRDLASRAEAVAVFSENPLKNIQLQAKNRKISQRSVAPNENLARDIIQEIGKDRLCNDLDVKDRVVNEYAKNGVMPASWFAYCEHVLGRELPRSMFNFKVDAVGEFV